jgi:AcrR family transcriptional regulator
MPRAAPIRNPRGSPAAPAAPKRPSCAAAAEAPARRRTQAERREEAEQRILEAALEIVARRGSVRMTLAEVGEAAGYSRGLPAQRFGNKAGLLRALAAAIGTRFKTQIRDAPQREPGLDAIRGNITVYFNRKDRSWTTTRALLVMFTEGFMEGSELRELVAAYNRGALSFFVEHIQHGIEKGEIPADIDPFSTSVLLLGALRGVMMQWLVDPEIDLSRVCDRMLAVVDAVLAKH